MISDCMFESYVLWGTADDLNVCDPHWNLLMLQFLGVVIKLLALTAAYRVTNCFWWFQSSSWGVWKYCLNLTQFLGCCMPVWWFRCSQRPVLELVNLPLVSWRLFSPEVFKAEHGGHSFCFGPQTTRHTHGSNRILNNVFCTFKRAVKCSVELERP